MTHPERSRPALPERINGLAGVAANLSWSWNRNARALFRLLDPALWRHDLHTIEAAEAAVNELLDQTMRPTALAPSYAALTRDEHFGAGGPFGVGQDAVLLHDQRAA